jgi:hypothetical protein
MSAPAAWASHTRVELAWSSCESLGRLITTKPPIRGERSPAPPLRPEATRGRSSLAAPAAGLPPRRRISITPEDCCGPEVPASFASTNGGVAPGRILHA